MLSFIKNLFGGAARAKRAEEEWPSIVLLLKAPANLTEQNVLDLAAKAWAAAATEPLKIVGRPRQGSFVIQVGKFFFAFHSANQPYEIEGQEKNEAQQKPWDQHTAWLSIDLPGGRLPKTEWHGIYSSLLLFIRLLWNDNCLAMYYPAEDATVPNLGDLIQRPTTTVPTRAPLEENRWIGKANCLN